MGTNWIKKNHLEKSYPHHQGQSLWDLQISCNSAVQHSIHNRLLLYTCYTLVFSFYTQKQFLQKFCRKPCSGAKHLTHCLICILYTALFNLHYNNILHTHRHYILLYSKNLYLFLCAHHPKIQNLQFTKISKHTQTFS